MKGICNVPVIFHSVAFLREVQESTLCLADMLMGNIMHTWVEGQDSSKNSICERVNGEVLQQEKRAVGELQRGVSVYEIQLKK